MVLTRYTVFGLLILPLIAGSSGCERKPPPDDQPFVRLLTEQTYPSNLLHRVMNYAVLLPKEYEGTNTTFPVVYLLHGFGDDETGWYKWGLINYYVDLYAVETIPMIYVMPEGFNSYWVNKYNGKYPLMDVIVNELVPTIDSLFHTIPDPQHRAVMGYSMGGYGAMILPAKNPEVFSTGVALSMSFRTDQQYMDEPQSVFDSQWGTVFGAIGASGTTRLTDYYKQYSPFYFFSGSFAPSRKGQHYFFDCGDDEESLSEPNNSLHNLLRDLKIRHEYRTRNGGHSWEYWRKALPEALKYIGFAVQDLPYPDDSDPLDPGLAIPSDRIVSGQTTGSGIVFNVALPAGYSTDTIRYPVIFILHDRDAAAALEESRNLLAMLNSNMLAKKVPLALMVEIPVPEEQITSDALNQIINQVRTRYRTAKDIKRSILVGNREGGRVAFNLLPDCSDYFSACLLFDANLPVDAVTNLSDVSYYLDISDEGTHYRGYHSLFMSARQNGITHEYRVRQGTPSHDTFLTGLNESAGFMNKNLF